MKNTLLYNIANNVNFTIVYYKYTVHVCVLKSKLVCIFHYTPSQCLTDHSRPLYTGAWFPRPVQYALHCWLTQRYEAGLLSWLSPKLSTIITARNSINNTSFGIPRLNFSKFALLNFLLVQSSQQSLKLQRHKQL